MNPWFCPHSETSAPDGSGRSICVRCGCVVRGVLTLNTLLLAKDQILHGVSFEDAWGNRIDPKDVHAALTVNQQGERSEPIPSG